MAQSTNDLIATLENFFAKAPALPASAKEVIVKIAPWLALIFGILGLLVGLGAVGVSPLALMGGVGASASVLISGVLLLVSSAMMLMAFPKLRAMKVEGWRLIFWSDVVSIVSSLIAFDIVGALLSFLIGFYILFQVKSYYK